MSGKSKRAAKRSKGIHGGGGKTRLTEIQKALLGKGLIDVVARRAEADRARKR